MLTDHPIPTSWFDDDFDADLWPSPDAPAVDPDFDSDADDALALVAPGGRAAS